MVFVPKTWANDAAGGTPIDAAELQRLEQGIVDANAGPDVQVFTANGTWTKPVGAIWVRVLVVSAGGGGGSGRRGAAGTVRTGGAAGGGGGLAFIEFPASLLGATEPVMVGTAGVGGAAVTTDNTNGNAGTAGGTSGLGGQASSFVNCRVSGFGAGGGAGGGTASAAGGYAGNALQGGGVGSISSGTGEAGSPSDTNFTPACAGGGSGGGITTSDVASIGGMGNRAVGLSGGPNYTPTPGGVVPGGAGGNAPIPYNNNDASPANHLGAPGHGGGGGASSVTTAGGAGGNASIYGGGGGGGGASLNGFASGKGGDGARGFVVVYTWR